jgi:hypothetical protein
MSTVQDISFIEYWDEVDAALLKLYAADTNDARIIPDLIAAAQEEGQAPEEFALWIGKQRRLRRCAETR